MKKERCIKYRWRRNRCVTYAPRKSHKENQLIALCDPYNYLINQHALLWIGNMVDGRCYIGEIILNILTPRTWNNPVQLVSRQRLTVWSVGVIFVHRRKGPMAWFVCFLHKSRYVFLCTCSRWMVDPKKSTTYRVPSNRQAYVHNEIACPQQLSIYLRLWVTINANWDVFNCVFELVSCENFILNRVKRSTNEYAHIDLVSYSIN